MPKMFYFEDNVYPKTSIDRIREISRGIVINEEKQIAVLKIYKDDIFGIRDCYELPGGGLKEYENHEQACIREMREEIGFNCEIICEIGEVIDFYNLIKVENHNHYFLAKCKEYVGSNLENYEKDMFQRLLWLDIDKVIDLFKNEMFGGVGKLISQRELPILMEARQLIKEMK